MATTNHVINFMANALGIRDATAHLEKMNRQIKLADGTTMRIVGLEKVKRDADGAYIALARLKQQATGVTGTAQVRLTPQTGLTGPAGLQWQAFAKGGGRWVRRMPSGMTQFAKKAEVAGFEGGPRKAIIPGKYATELDKTTLSTKNLDKASKGLIGTQIKLATRALAVIPLWMLFRSVYSELLSIFTVGFRTWREMDRAMLKAKAVIHDSTMSMENSLISLRTQVDEVAATTGTAMTKLTGAFYRFGTVGLDFETSMGGMIASNKAAVAMMGETDSIAKVLARTYRLLGHTMDQTLSSGDQMSTMAAKLFLLWKDNAFEITGMNESLMQFLPTANTLNFTYNETVSLLAALNSAAVINSRAGRLLRTSLGQQAKNWGQIANVLGLSVNPAMESQFEILMRILGAINKLQKSGADVTEVGDKIGKIFGGVRGQEPIKALAAVYDLVISNLEKMGQTSEEVNKKLDERVAEVNRGLDAQLKKFGVLRTQIYETFVQGVVGGDNFVDSLGRINLALIDVKKNAEDAGKFIAFLGGPLKVPFLLKDIIQGKMGLQDMEKLNREMEAELARSAQAMGISPGLTKEQIAIEMKKIKDSIEESQITLKPIVVSKSIKDLEEEKIKFPKLSTEVKMKLDAAKEELKYIDLAIKGYTQEEILQQKLLDMIKAKVNEVNKRILANGELIEQLDAQVILSMALNDEWQNINNAFGYSKEQEKDLLTLQKAALAITKERANEMLKLANAFESTFKGALKDVLLGEGEGFFEAISEKFKDSIADAFATGVSEQFFKSSGIGEMFGGIMTGIKGKGAGLLGGMEKVHAVHVTETDKVLTRHVNGMARVLGVGVDPSKFATGGIFGRGGMGMGAGAGVTIPGFGPGGFMGTPLLRTMKRPKGFIGPMPKGGFRTGTTPSQLLAVGGTTALSAMGGAQGPGGMISGIAGGIGSGIMGAASLGMFGAANVAGVAGATTTGMMGLGALIPGIGLALVVASLIFSMLSKPEEPEFRREQIKEQTKQIGSRIDITNKQLEWVNRNLVALRQEITFILPESAYFSERTPEDRFALDSQRGF